MLTLFESPEFFKSLREDVVPWLRTFPQIRVWVPGAGGGEDAYALAIVFHEEGLGDRFQVYATDAVLPETDGPSVLHLDPGRYLAAGGRSSLAEYFSGSGSEIVVKPALSAGILFAQHDLATDVSFNEFQFICGRNGVGTGERDQRAAAVVCDSLCRFGILARGTATWFDPCVELMSMVTVGSSGHFFRRTT